MARRATTGGSTPERGCEHNLISKGDRMIVKLAVLAAIVLFGFTGFANAQTSQAVVAPPAASATGVTNLGTAASNAWSASTKPGEVSLAVVTGWHFMHATNCLITFDGTFNTLYVYPSEGGFVTTAGFQYQALISPSCQTGNWIGIYVDNVGFSGHWSNLMTFGFK
jgi:hypothetical protein